MAINLEYKTYREELIDIIKDCGQDLIERAEEMVGENAEYIKGFRITIDIPNAHDGDPTISWSGETLCKNFWKRRLGDKTFGDESD